jgi:hypothetical protein
MFLLGFGIVLLFPIGLAVINAESVSQVIGVLGCTALIPVPMIVAGIVMIRRVEDAADRKSGAVRKRRWSTAGNGASRHN